LDGTVTFISNNLQQERGGLLLEEHSLIAAQQVVGEERNAAGSCEHRAVCSILMGARWLSLAVS
jgi:hypothetical protein